MSAAFDPAAGHEPMELLERAVRLAVRRHQGQLSKGDGEPFITHPVAVALLCGRAGLDDATVAAALLHDVLEDTDTTREELAAAVGERVADAVDHVTKAGDGRPWRDEMRSYVERLRGAPRQALAVAAADKVHNLFRLVRAVEREGPDVERRFNSTFAERLAAYGDVRDVVRERWPDCPLLPALDRELRRANETLR
ncbi:MAG: HD domain-containing protein [Gemmatimonadota bacterium]